MIFVGRTVGYGVEQLSSGSNKCSPAQGVFGKVRVAIGGMAVHDELAKGSASRPATARTRPSRKFTRYRTRPRTGAQYHASGQTQTGVSLRARLRGQIPTTRKYLDQIVDGILDWTADKTSPGVIRARDHRVAIAGRSRLGRELHRAAVHARLSGAMRRGGAWIFSRKTSVRRASGKSRRRRLTPTTGALTSRKKNFHPRVLQHGRAKPLVFVQYGTGCPMMDGMHIKVSESWGADGVLHFDPAWGARTEGLMDGFLTNAEDGTPVTYANLSLIKRSLDEATLWTVRAHRGLNTPEIAVLSGFLGADLTKINIVYGSICGGTDPARLTVDGVEAMRTAVRYNMPFDIPTNEELAGVPPHKAFAGMLIMAQLGRRLGAQPILKPLLCHGPYIMVNELMEQNYVDFNFAKIRALQALADFPDLARRADWLHDAHRGKGAIRHHHVAARRHVRRLGRGRGDHGFDRRGLFARADHVGRPRGVAALDRGGHALLRADGYRAHGQGRRMDGGDHYRDQPDVESRGRSAVVCGGALRRPARATRATACIPAARERTPCRP